MKYETELRITVSFFLAWLMILMPIEIADALSITNVDISDITHNSATVSWTTDESSSGKVEYGTDIPPDESALNQTDAKVHSVKLKGLLPAALYYYSVEAFKDTTQITANNSGNYFEFTTETAPDTIPPVALIKLYTESYGKDFANIRWEKDPADVDVHRFNVYRDGDLVATRKYSYYETSGLTSGTTYNYEVAALDDSDNEGPKSALSVTTRDENWKEITVSQDSVKADVIGTSVSVSWTTNEKTNSIVKYGTDPALMDKIVSEVDNVSTIHRVTLTDLNEFTNYSFYVMSCDEFNNCGTSSQEYPIQFKTRKKVDLYLQVNIPNFYNNKRMPIEGRASEGADIFVYLDGVKHRHTKVGDSEEFSILTSLDPNKRSDNPNMVKVTATDASGKTISSETVAVLVDSTPPDVLIDSISDFNSESTLLISGNVTDDYYPVTGKFYIYSTTDTTPPPVTSGLINNSIQPNSVGLEWDVVNDTETGLEKYLVYRSDVGLIAETTDARFVDDTVSTNTDYEYQIAAMDKAGNIGSKSAELRIQTLEGGVIKENPEAIELKSPALKKTVEINSAEFHESIGPLYDGDSNRIVLEFTDQAGNKYEEEHRVVYDSTPPTILKPTNLGAYSPSYTRDLSIYGKVDDNATVYAIVVNAEYPDSTDLIGKIKDIIGVKNEPPGAEDVKKVLGITQGEVYSTRTNTDGTFELYIALTGNPITVVDSNSGTQAVGSSLTGRNKVILVAVDSAGLIGEKVEDFIDYARCGSGTGTYWDVKITDFTPIYLSASQILKGIASYSFTYTLKWIGPSVQPATINQVRFTPVTLSAESESEYDNKWIKVNAPTFNQNKTFGYVRVDVKVPYDPQGKTNAEKSKNISDHRKSSCPLLPGTTLVTDAKSTAWKDSPFGGCLRTFMKMEIDFDSPAMIDTALAQQQVPVGKQVYCVDRWIQIDPRLNASLIPKDLLTSSIDALNASIAFIDLIFEPIQQIYTWVWYACVAGFVGNLVLSVAVEWNCRFSPLMASDSLVGIAKSALELETFQNVAAQGKNMCTWYAETHSKKGDDKEKDQIENACNACGDSIANFNNYQNKYHYVCDRVVCPSVPSLQQHIKETKKTSLFSKNRLGDDGSAISAAVDNLKDAGRQASKGTKAQKLIAASAPSDCAFVESANAETVKKIKDNYDKNKEFCGEPHMYQAACCGYDYKYTWDPAILLQDPLKKSYCLAFPEDEANCGVGGRIMDGIAGICKGDGEESQELGSSSEIIFKETKAKQEPNLFYRVELTSEGTIKDVCLGFIKKSYKDSSSGPEADEDDEDEYAVSNGLKFKCAWRISKDAFDTVSTKDPDSDKKAVDGEKTFRDEFKGNGDLMRNLKTAEDPSIDKLYQEIAKNAGTVDQQYIAEPSSSFIQSVVTVCLSSFTSYLTRLRNMLMQMKICFHTILITGDGSAGTCEALVTQGVCDLFYEALDCFIQRFSAVNERIGAGVGGNFLGALTSAGDRVSKAANDRYGENNVLTNQFSISNLAHGTCMWMFTGEFPSDWDNFLKVPPAAPIDSYAVIPVANRRFVGFDPNEGQSEYTYQFSFNLFAGSDINFYADLICSGEEGNCPYGEGGKCDCAYATDPAYKTRRVPLSDVACSPSCDQPLSKDGVCDMECNIANVKSPVRFDKVRICWEGYKNPSESSTSDVSQIKGCEDANINEIGQAPSICKFDLGTLSFNCGLSLGGTGYAAIRQFSAIRDPALFEVGDKKIVKLNIVQTMPGASLTTTDLDTNATKYLEITVKNQYGDQVWPPKGKDVQPYRLNIPGGQEITFFDPATFAGLDLFEITPSMFAKNEQRESCNFKFEKDFGIARMNSCPVQTKTVGTAGKAVKVVDFGPKPGSHSLKYVSGDYVNGMLYIGEKPLGGVPADRSKNDEIVTDSDKLYSPCEESSPSPANGYTAKCGGFDFKVTDTFYKTAPKIPEGGKNYFAQFAPSVTLYYNPATDSEPEHCDRTPETWTVEATIYNSINDGGVWHISKNDVAKDNRGIPQRFIGDKAVQIQVMCQKTGGVSQGALVGTIVLTSETPTIGAVSASGLLGEDKVYVKDVQTIRGGFEANVQVSLEDANLFAITKFDVSDFGLKIPTTNTVHVEPSTITPCDGTTNQELCFRAAGKTFEIQATPGKVSTFKVTGLIEDAPENNKLPELVYGSSVMLTAYHPLDYGVTVTGLDESKDENVIISNFRPLEGNNGFLLDITPSVAGKTININWKPFAFEADTNLFSVERTNSDGEYEPIAKCGEANCYTNVGAKYTELKLVDGFNTYRFTNKAQESEQGSSGNNLGGSSGVQNSDAIPMNT